jgi:ADP-ribosyl-[dinitrogen reductase] hydrolase
MSNVLMAGAIGDALGVFAETKLPSDPLLVNWDGKTFLGSKHHNLLPGQFSDDTQLSLEVAESLLQFGDFNPANLAERYVDWITSGRARGFGNTTLKAVQNLQAGISYRKSGIANSFGNGTAMRAAPFGVFFRDDINKLVESVKIDSAITHASDDAEAGALAIALSVAYLSNNDSANLLEKVCEFLPKSNVKRTLLSLDALLTSNITARQSLRVLGTGADVKQTVPAALYCFLKFDNYSDAIITAIRAGGDTDTTAKIIGDLFGARDGLKGISKSWINKIEDNVYLMSIDNMLYFRSKSRSDLFPR